MQSYINENDFEFDCPKTVVNINNSLNGNNTKSDVIDPWFFQIHPEHKEQPPPVLTEIPLENEEDEDAVEKQVMETAVRKRSRSSTLAPTSTSLINKQTLPRKTKSRTNSDLTKSTASSVARRRSAEVTAVSKKVVSLKKKKQTAPEPRRTSTRTLTQEVVDPPASSLLPSPPPQKVSVEMKSFDTFVSSASRKAKKSASSTAAPAAPQSRSAKLEEYRRQKQQQTQPEITVAQKRSVSSRQAVEQQPPAKKTQLVRATSKAKPASTATAATKNKNKNDKENVDVDMLDLLKQHNKKFQPVALYEPSRHSVRDVRRWEKASGKTWSSLKPDERERANEDIMKLKISSS
jgi:hypothetical protein